MKKIISILFLAILLFKNADCQERKITKEFFDSLEIKNLNLLYIGNNEFIKFAGNIPFISANFNEILFNSSDSIIFVQGNLFDRYNEKHPTIKDFIVLLGNYYTDTNSSNNISTFIQKIKFPSKMH